MKFKHNGAIIENGKDIANYFNQFFVNVGKNLASKIPSSKKNASDYMKNCNPDNCIFTVNAVSEEEIAKINFKSKR